MTTTTLFINALPHFKDKILFLFHAYSVCFRHKNNKNSMITQQRLIAFSNHKQNRASRINTFHFLDAKRFASKIKGCRTSYNKTSKIFNFQNFQILTMWQANSLLSLSGQWMSKFPVSPATWQPRIYLKWLKNSESHVWIKGHSLCIECCKFPFAKTNKRYPINYLIDTVDLLILTNIS